MHTINVMCPDIRETELSHLDLVVVISGNCHLDNLLRLDIYNSDVK